MNKNNKDSKNDIHSTWKTPYAPKIAAILFSKMAAVTDV